MEEILEVIAERFPEKILSLTDIDEICEEYNLSEEKCEELKDRVSNEYDIYDYYEDEVNVPDSSEKNVDEKTKKKAKDSVVEDPRIAEMIKAYEERKKEIDAMSNEDLCGLIVESRNSIKAMSDEKLCELKTEEEKNQDLLDKPRLEVDIELAEYALTNKNEGWIYTKARYLNNCYPSRLSFDELKWVGQAAMLAVVNEYDPSYRGKFLTYAGYWIMKEIKNEIAERGFYFRMTPEWLYRSHLFWRVTNRIMESENGISNEDEFYSRVAKELKEISKENRDRNKINKAKGIEVEGKDYSRKEIEDGLKIYIAAHPYSMESQIGGDDKEGLTYKDILADTSIPSPFEQLTEKESIENLMKTFEVLTQREAYVLAHRGYEDKTRILSYEDLAFKFKLPEQAIKDIEEKAIRKVRRFHFFSDDYNQED